MAQGTTSASAEPIIKQIIKDEIRLARFNLNYRLQATKQGRWKGLRYFAFQEANAALTESGLIAATSQHLGHLPGESFRRINIRTLEDANIQPAIGQILAGSGSALELLINAYHSYRTAGSDFSPGAAIGYVRKVQGDIDNNLRELKQLAESEEPQLSRVHLLEQRVLTDIRDLLINEFDGFHIRARRALWNQQSFYVLDIAKNVTGVIGNYYSYKALHDRRAIFNQPASVLTTISGALILSNPITCRVIGRAVGALDRRALKQAGVFSSQSTHSQLKDDLHLLRVCLKNGSEQNDKSPVGLDRFAAYEAHQGRLLKQLNISSKEIQAGNRIAIQNIFSGILVGGTKMTLGILFMDAAFNNLRNPKVSNALLGSGNLVYLLGASWAVADNARIQMVGEYDRYRLRKQHKLPAQLITEQLQQLDLLEQSLK